MYKFKQKIKMLPNEKWWGGCIDDGIHMPYKLDFEGRDINDNNLGNQFTSFFISSKGRYFYSDEPIKYEIKHGTIIVQSIVPIDVVEGFSSLKEAYADACKKNFKLPKKHIDMDMFVMPQYNTWIELQYNQNEQDILNYAKSIVDNGLPPGILMIDDNWQEDYGVWKFHEGRFKNPKSMIDKLHKMGFKVMLWICPFMSPDSETFRDLEAHNNFFVKTKDKKPYIVNWWNGYSAVLDFTNKQAVSWFKKQCDALMKDYGVDGFKFDAADTIFYPYDGKYNLDIARSHQARIYSDIATNYPLNEMRSCFNDQGKNLAQRLGDKRHSWHDRGINMLVPNGIAMSTLGYAFCCPDMIGGGLIWDFTSADSPFDQELFIRYAQIATFFPMMQFSIAPWKVLSPENMEIIRNCVKLHTEVAPYIQELVENAYKTGEPIIRSMEYEYPNMGYESIVDQFMLGSKYLIAPISEKGKTHRLVKMPKGMWKDPNGNIIRGGKVVPINTPLDVLPYYEKITTK